MRSALVKVRDRENRIDVLGASSAEKSKPFSYTLAVNKAERNAFAKLIPAKWFAVLIEEYLQRKQSKPTLGRPGQTPPQPDREEWLPKVPVVKDPIVREGLKQHPLIQGTLSIGMLNVLEEAGEASIVPEKCIPPDSPPVQSFLIPRILDAMKEKYADFDYRLDLNQDGMLRAILIRGRLGEAQLKELGNAARWAFQRAQDKQAPSG